MTGARTTATRATDARETATARAAIATAGALEMPPVVAAPGGFGLAGGAGTRLLAGPPAASGTEALQAHLARLGPLPRSEPGQLQAIVRAAGLRGRGGADFPFAIKLDAAAEAAAAAKAAGACPLVVVNASEGEPASRKDRVLCELRPHTVLDGAEAAARALGADEVVVLVHESRTRSVQALRKAVAERAASAALDRRAPIAVRLLGLPPGYLAGESSAAVAFVEGGSAIPVRRHVPVAVAGVDGRPTLFSNAETFAHLALVARFGATWFRSAGSAASPGSTLVTLGGAVAVPGLVVEVIGTPTIGEVLDRFGGLDHPPQAVLVGGYGGHWLDGTTAASAPCDRGGLKAAGAALGCGLLGVLPASSCGLAETRRLVEYLAGQSAGQCGPCAYGLSAMTELLQVLDVGPSLRRDVRQLRQVAATTVGRGDCGLPDGAVTLVESALDVFALEVRHHRRKGRCSSEPTRGIFPVPARVRVTEAR